MRKTEKGEAADSSNRERGERESERARRADATTTGVGNFRDHARIGKLSQ